MKNLTNEQISKILNKKISQKEADGFRKLATQPKEVLTLIRKSANITDAKCEMKKFGFSQKQISIILETRLARFVELMNEFEVQYS